LQKQIVHTTRLGLKRASLDFFNASKRKTNVLNMRLQCFKERLSIESSKFKRNLCRLFKDCVRFQKTFHQRLIPLEDCQLPSPRELPQARVRFGLLQHLKFLKFLSL
jgi:hypothetical protein